MKQHNLLLCIIFVITFSSGIFVKVSPGMISGILHGTSSFLLLVTVFVHIKIATKKGKQ